MKLNKLLKNAGRYISKHSPEILTGLGVAAMVTGTVLAVKNTGEAIDIINEMEGEKGESLTKGEVVRATWKVYVGPAISTVTGAACIIGASAKNYKRNAALSAAYTLSQKTLFEFKEAVKDTVSETDMDAIRDKVNKKQIEDNLPEKRELYLDERGKYLFFEPITRTYFRDTVNNFNAKLNRVNSRLLGEVQMSLKEFLMEMDIEPIVWSDTDETLYWRSDLGLIDVSIAPVFIEDHEIAIAMNYNGYIPTGDKKYRY